MANRVQHEVAIITGGASGIGRALGEELARGGCEVVFADRQIEVAEQVATEVRDRGGLAAAAELDVRDFGSYEKLVGATLERTGRIDYLFNNAGIGVGGEIDRYELRDWDDVFDVNLRGVAYGIHAVYPTMIRQGSGHIVNTASVAGLLPAAGEGSYVASKYAVVGLSKTLRIEAKQHGIRVSVLCPGVVRTPILTGGRYGRANHPGLTDDAILSLWQRLKPMEPELFARQSLAAVFRNEAIIIVPRWWKALWYFDRFAPAASLKLWGVMFGHMKKELERLTAQGE